MGPLTLWGREKKKERVHPIAILIQKRKGEESETAGGSSLTDQKARSTPENALEKTQFSPSGNGAGKGGSTKGPPRWGLKKKRRGGKEGRKRKKSGRCWISGFR